MAESRRRFKCAFWKGGWRVGGGWVVWSVVERRRGKSKEFGSF